MTRLSVIIPVYNSSSTLRRCIDSVLSQNVSDMEIILVDDGSVDGSSDLCDSLASDTPFIRVIHRPNGGLSEARNTGIEAAQGTWITFIDSDDALAPDTLNGNLDIAVSDSSIDLVEYPVTVRYGSPHSFDIDFEPITVTGDNVFRHWIESQGYNHCFAWNKIYRRELFRNIRYPSGESFEDAAICPDIIRACHGISYSQTGRYLYYESQGGITHRYRFSNQEPLFRHNLNLLIRITEAGYDLSCRMRLWSVCLNLLTDLARCKDADHGHIREQSKRLDSLRPGLKPVFNSSLSSRQKTKALAAWLFGVRTVCSVLGIKKYR